MEATEALPAAPVRVRRPKDLHTKHLTTEQRARVRTLHFDARMSYGEIREATGFTKSQIQTACIATQAAPKPHTGRRRDMSVQQEAELVEFVCVSKANRRISWLELSQRLFVGVFGLYVIRELLRRLGFRRRIARRKPPLSEANKLKRLAWALEHVNWSFEDWCRILWSDETWVTGGHHRKQYVTRRVGEEWDETCLVERHQRKGGWMFWGCFSGATGKGPGIFWEKDWGKINADTYQEHTIPMIDGWLQINRWYLHRHDLILMHDGAPGHAAEASKQELIDRHIPVMAWPPYSPDLNPIETVWNWMKDYIEDKWGLDEKPSYDNLRKYVKEAWEAVPEEWLLDLIKEMPTRCQAVIDAQGGHTRH
ncbi:hypothetical protein DL765_005056 [Monosporascus sp. GIB2]|nr:hypothetical protein DL765_005056 [Monosporascus sp. GIB2]